MLNGTATNLITVDGMRDNEVHDMLGHVKCEVVKDKHLFFFLPFDTNIS